MEYKHGETDTIDISGYFNGGNIDGEFYKMVANNIYIHDIKHNVVSSSSYSVGGDVNNLSLININKVSQGIISYYKTLNNLYVKNVGFDTLNFTRFSPFNKLEMENIRVSDSLSFYNFREEENMSLKNIECSNVSNIREIFSRAAVPSSFIQNIFQQLNSQNIKDCYRALADLKITSEDKTVNFPVGGNNYLLNLAANSNIENLILRDGYTTTINGENMLYNCVDMKYLEIQNAKWYGQDARSSLAGWTYGAALPKLNCMCFNNCNEMSTLTLYTNIAPNLTNVSIKNCNKLQTIYFYNKGNIENVEIVNCLRLMSLSGMQNTRITNIQNLLDVCKAGTSFQGMFSHMTTVTQENLIVDGNILQNAVSFYSTFYNWGQSGVNNFIIKNFENNRNVNLGGVIAKSKFNKITFENIGYNAFSNAQYAGTENPSEYSIKEYSFNNCNYDIGSLINGAFSISLENMFVANQAQNTIICKTGVFRNSGELKYITTNENILLAVSCWSDSIDVSKYSLNFYKDIDEPLYLTLFHNNSYTKPDVFLPTVGRKQEILSLIPEDELKAFSGINNVIFDYTNLAKTGEIRFIPIGAKNFTFKNIGMTADAIQINALGRLSEVSLDKYMMVNTNISFGDVSNIRYISANYHNSQYLKPDYIKEISFTNFGQGYIDSKYTSRPHLNFVYLTGLNQGCLENIITNGIVNLAAASKTGNIYLSNAQMTNLTESTKNLAQEKGWRFYNG